MCAARLCHESAQACLRGAAGAELHDLEQARADLHVTARDERETAHAAQEIYQWPGDHAQPVTGNDAHLEGERIARLRMEALRQHGVRVYGKGNVRAPAPGHSFHLTGFLAAKANREYLICAVRLELEEVAERTGTERQWRCKATFEAQPSNEAFRPTPKSKPVIPGYLVATVVCPEGEEIWCDEFGRVRVRFPWDREGSQTCLLRVAEGASGARWGETFVPRDGQEVSIGFLGGDPDRPLITGRLDNRLNMPPWDLPSQRALSGYASHELGGIGRNATIYDDTTGEQQVQIASAHQHSLLALGHNVRIPDGRGRQDKRCEGFELRTDGQGAIRANGMLITTQARRAAEGHALALQETIVRFEQALAEARNVLEASVAFVPLLIPVLNDPMRLSYFGFHCHSADCQLNPERYLHARDYALNIIVAILRPELPFRIADNTTYTAEQFQLLKQKLREGGYTVTDEPYPVTEGPYPMAEATR